jgi:Lon protease-like protein
MKCRLSLVCAVCGWLLVVPALPVQAQTASTESAPALPASIPLFPLPSVVLFPDVSLPLRVFEPRYRAMIESAMQSDRIIGIVLLRSGFEGDHGDTPPVYAIATAAEITKVEALADGRFNIVVRGLTKVRITGEKRSGPFRVAQVEAIPETPDKEAAASLRELRPKLEQLVATSIGLSFQDLGIAEAPDAEVVNALAFHFDFDPLDSQGLLEQNGVLARAEALIQLLESNSALPR